MGKARKASRDFQHKEVSLVGKARKYSSVNFQHKEVSLVGKAKKYSLDFQHKEVNFVAKARKASRMSSIKRLVRWERPG